MNQRPMLLVLLLALSATAQNTTFSLENWMQALYPVIANQTLLDLTLPGTHDSMTWDLSDTVSDGANDISPTIAWILHEFRFLTPGPFIHNQSQTQRLNMTQQLDAGIRFIDFRIMYSSSPNKSATASHDWYCLHFVETKHTAMTYLTELRHWLDAHPGEIVVLWLSRHGDNCGTEYPDVSQAEKTRFFSQLTDLFGGLLINRETSPTNETTVAQLLARQQRVLVYLSDHANFTQGSPLASNGCLIDNQLGNDVTNETDTYQKLVARFAQANATKAADKRANMFFLQSMAGGGPDSQIKDAALLHFQPFDHSNLRASCAKDFHVPNMTDWCPMTLIECSQLTNYYNQLVLDAVISEDLHYPNAIYLDAVEAGGLIKTNTTNSLTDTGFAYCDSLILYNVRQACRGQPQNPHCAALTATLEARRAQYPVRRWTDYKHGRLPQWPLPDNDNK